MHYEFSKDPSGHRTRTATSVGASLMTHCHSALNYAMKGEIYLDSFLDRVNRVFSALNDISISLQMKRSLDWILLTAILLSSNSMNSPTTYFGKTWMYSCRLFSWNHEHSKQEMNEYICLKLKIIRLTAIQDMSLPYFVLWFLLIV